LIYLYFSFAAFFSLSQSHEEDDESRKEDNMSSSADLKVLFLQSLQHSGGIGFPQVVSGWLLNLTGVSFIAKMTLPNQALINNIKYKCNDDIKID
jgi:hypothetical protein